MGGAGAYWSKSALAAACSTVPAGTPTSADACSEQHHASNKQDEASQGSAKQRILRAATRVMINKIGLSERDSAGKRGVIGLGDRPEVVLHDPERGPAAALPAGFEAS